MNSQSIVFLTMSINQSTDLVTSTPGNLQLAARSPSEELANQQLPMALTFLSGYHPRVFDAILNAVEPCAEAGDGDEMAGQEPFCVLCVPVGIFLAHGADYRHYRGVLTATSKPRPYKADHVPVIGWRPTSVAAKY